MKRSALFVAPLFLALAGCGGDGNSTTGMGGFTGLGMMKPAGTAPGGTPMMMGGGLGGLATPPGTMPPAGTTPPGTTPPAGATVPDLKGTIWYMAAMTPGCFSYVTFDTSTWVGGDACPLQGGTIAVENFGGSYTRSGASLTLNLQQTSCPEKISAGVLNATYAVTGNNIAITLPNAMLNMTSGNPPLGMGTFAYGCFTEGGFVPATGN